MCILRHLDLDLVPLKLGQGALMVHCEVEKLAPAGVFTAWGTPSLPGFIRQNVPSLIETQICQYFNPTFSLHTIFKVF